VKTFDKKLPDTKTLDIVHEDEFCIVVNKPAGLAVQGGKGIAVSLDGLLAAFRAERPLLVHRLDRDTSGLILAAKDRKSAAFFSELFAGRRGGGGPTVVKRYLALCGGIPERPAGTIRLPLDVRGSLKESETRFALARTFADRGFSLLELELGTGRMHQIRRHLAMTGLPVLGDDRYGDFALNRRLRKETGLRKLLLHAAFLGISRMPDGSALELEVPPPGCFGEFLGKLVNHPEDD